MQVEAGRFVCKLVRQMDTQALTLQHAQHQRLDDVALQAERYAVGAPARGGAHLLDVPGERVHSALRVVVAVAVEGNVYGQRDDVVLTYRGAARAPRAADDRLRSKGSEHETLGGVVPTRGDG